MNAMQAVLLKPFPLALKDARAGARDAFHGDTWQGDAWQRELQRAQSTLAAAPIVAFLQGFGDVKVEPAPIVHAIDAVESAPATDAPAIASAPREAAEAPVHARAPTSAATSTAQAAQAAIVRSRSHETHVAPLRAMAASRLAPPAVHEPTVRPPVRVHADWSADGVRIWLGIDVTTAAAVQSIASQLQRWLVAQGVRGMAIACNGRAVVEHWPDIDGDPAEPSSIEPKEKT